MNEHDAALFDIYYRFCLAEGTTPGYSDFILWVEEQGYELTEERETYQDRRFHGQ